MSIYIRPKSSGAVIFFTVCLADRRSDLLVRKIGLLRDAVRVTRAERPFEIVAWVVLPEHVHCIWKLPGSDGNFSVRWGAIKSRFTMSLRKSGFSLPPDLPVVQNGRYAGMKPGLRVAKRERAVWQRRYWEHHVRSREELNALIGYCWFNPVKYRLAHRPAAWPYSSFHRDVRLGRVLPDWQGCDVALEAGEPNPEGGTAASAFLRQAE